MKTTTYTTRTLTGLVLVGLVALLSAVSLQSRSQGITLLSPNGGEVWIQGSTSTISWQIEGDPADVLIEFNDDGSNYFYYLTVINASDSTSSFTFQNFFYATTQAKVRVSFYNDPSVADESDGFFTVVEPPVYINSPYYGENYYRTMPVYISWYSYTLTAFNLDYTLDNGTTWTNIVTDYTGFDYTWTAPDQATDQAMIRISDPSNPDSYGLSVVFSITDIPTLTLTTPNGGETWNYGELATVSWTGTNLPGYLYIQFSGDGGETWTYLQYGYSGPDGGSAEIYVPYVETDIALVRVQDPEYEQVTAQSASYFSVVVPPVIVHYPYEGQQIYQKSELYVSWQAYEMNLVNIEVSPDNGLTWQTVAENVDATYGYFYWTVMATPSTNSVIRISDAADPSRFGLSPVFTVLEAPVITLNAPAGGTVFNTNAPLTISWSYDNPSAYYLYLDYSIDSGATWNYINYVDHAGNGGSYEWTTPDVNSGQCFIRIRDYSLYFVSDTTEAFRIITFPETPICMVSVDTLTGRNVIMWEKPASDLIEQFIVYKESSQANVYEVLATVDYASAGMVTDTNSNPAIKPYRYKLGFSGMDGVVFPAGDYHQTIHLTINQGVNSSWNLIWTGYVGFQASSYIIHRKSGNGAFEQIASISASFSTYTDFNTPVGDVYYMVEVINPDGCAPETRSGVYNSTFSNVATNSTLAVGDEREISFGLYPNPADDHADLSFGNQKISNASVAISDLAGRTVFHAAIGDQKPGSIYRINTTGLHEGIYILQVISGDIKTTRKLIVNR